MIHRNEFSVSIEPMGRYLRFRYDFVAPLSMEQARRYLQDYFTKLGYSLVSSDDVLVMKRGSLVHSLVNWAPRNLAAELTARFAPLGKDTAVMLELQLDRMGHIVFDAECCMLTTELVQAETYLHGRVVDFEAMEQLDRRIRNQEDFNPPCHSQRLASEKFLRCDSGCSEKREERFALFVT